LRPRAKKCDICKMPIENRRNSLQVVCSMACALELNKRREAKKRKAETQKMKVDTRSHSEWIAVIQPNFNKLIREIDKFQPCISSGNAWINGGMDSGHYWPTSTHGRLRFHFLNVWAESKNSNGFDSSHLIGYRKNLIGLFGQSLFDEIDSLPQKYQTLKWDIPTLKEADRLIKVFRKEAQMMPILTTSQRLEVRRDFMSRFVLY